MNKITLNQATELGIWTQNFIGEEEQEYLMNVVNLLNKSISSLKSEEKLQVLQFLENGEYDTLSNIIYRLLWNCNDIDFNKLT